MSIVSPNVVSSPTLVGQTGAIDVLHKADGNPRDFVVSTATATVTATFIPLTDARAAGVVRAQAPGDRAARHPSAPWGDDPGGGARSGGRPDGASPANRD